MITVHLSGGLGNQLFQYAAGLAVAVRLGAGLQMETRKFRSEKTGDEDPAARPLRVLDFELPFRNVCDRRAEDRLRSRWNLSRNLHIPARWLKFFTETGVAYDPAFESLGDGVCLRGYFQSELYFANIAPDVRRAFRPCDETLTPRIDADLARLRQSGRALVSLHVRRGDFLDLTDRDCMTGDDFYDKAMSAFPGALFMVFSDDLNWCREKFAGREDIVFSPYARVTEDFVAMSRCDHHILAKSTFSWWAAWLNDRPERQVLAPFIAPQETWGGGGPDYYPRDWTIL